MNKIAIKIALFSAVGVFAGAASGADRALIVGVGEYANPESNLFGIDLDVDNMVEVAKLMGFEGANIMTLEDSSATAENIVRAMATWLVEDVEPDDRVLFYFSGHGSRLKDSDGDEPDGLDEVIVPHDALALADDDIGYLLDLIPSRNIMVFIDSCHSGSATRTLDADPVYFGVDEVYAKFVDSGSAGVTYRNEQSGTRQRREFEGKNEAGSGYVAVTAARDDEVAVATRNGGAFTLGLTRAIRAAVRSGEPLTPSALRNYIERYIAEILSPDSRHHPQVSGDPSKFSEPLPLASIETGPAQTPGTVWSSIVERVEEYGRTHGRLGLSTNATQYRLGQNVEITVNVPSGGGYLNVVTVDARDQSTVLFPNQFHRDNRVSAGALRIPTSQMSFTLPASEPLGETLVVAFLSTEPVNLYDNQVGGRRSANGDYAEVFAEVSAPGMRAISVAGKERDESIRAGQLVVNTVR